jgi:hypothetical protein
MRATDAAVRYAERGWPVFPMSHQKVPLTTHGRSDATCDPAIIRDWFTRWPAALPAIATGEHAGVVAFDVDMTDRISGWDSLAEIGTVFAPATPMAHTPRGGTHLLFRHPGAGVHVKTIAGKVGPALDVRGDGGSVIMPPGPGRFWDPHYGEETPLAPMPDFMLLKEPKPTDAEPRRDVTVRLSKYAETALDNAVARIVAAPAGQQETTLNIEAYSIGRLAGGSAIPAGLALDALTWAARRMRSHDARRPWREGDLIRKVRTAFTDGLTQPRRAPS